MYAFPPGGRCEVCVGTGRFEPCVRDFDGGSVTLWLDPQLDKKAFDEARAWCREVKLAREREEATQRQRRSVRGKPAAPKLPQADFGDMFEGETDDDE